MKRNAAKHSSPKLPANGTRKITNDAVTTRIMSQKPIATKGSVLPKMSSRGRIGVTINCSIVPISFSRTMAMAVSDNVTSMMMFTTTPGTK